MKRLPSICLIVVATSCAPTVTPYDPIISQSPAPSADQAVGVVAEEGSGDPVYAMVEGHAFSSCEEMAMQAEIMVQAQLDDNQQMVGLAWLDEKSGEWLELPSCQTKMGLATGDDSLLSWLPVKKTVTARAFVAAPEAATPAAAEETAKPNAPAPSDPSAEPSADAAAPPSTPRSK